MAPIRLTPERFEKVWGSTKLEPWFRNPSKQKTGEVWFQGVPNSPLLIKLLFTSKKLSVQVHPGDAYAQQHHGSRGKTEMWHVLRAKPGARIAAGFREPVTAEQLRGAALSGKITRLLQWHDAQAGDTFFIPAGTVHAIGEGLVLCEIQQHSDVTYRLYDYGRPRELHLEHALQVSRREPHAARCPIEKTDSGGTPGDRLVSCEFFTTDKIHLAGSMLHTPAQGTCEWWIVIEGSVEIAGQAACAGEVWYAAPGQAAFEMSGNAVLLRTSAPPSVPRN